MSASKRKGSAFERDVVAYLVGHGFPWAERRALAGNLDKGDIAGVPGVVLECKNTKALDLAGAINEAEAEARNAGVSIFAAVIKRRQRPAGDAYVVMPLHVLCQILGDDDTLRKAAS